MAASWQPACGERRWPAHHEETTFSPFCFTLLLLVLLVSPTVVEAQTVAGMVSTIAGSTSLSSGSNDGIGTSAQFNFPAGVAMDPAGTFAIVVSLDEVHVREGE